MVDVNKEIDSFVLKFRQLWSAGLDAHLDLETHAGNAWVGLKLNVGQYRPNPVGEFFKRASPSRIRRRERRAASYKCDENKVGLPKKNNIRANDADRKVSDSIHVNNWRSCC